MCHILFLVYVMKLYKKNIYDLSPRRMFLKKIILVSGVGDGGLARQGLSDLTVLQSSIGTRREILDKIKLQH